MEQGGLERFESHQEEKSWRSGKSSVAANDFPRPFGKIVWQWRAVQGNTSTSIRGGLVTRATGELGRTLASVWPLGCGSWPVCTGDSRERENVPVSWKLHLDYQKGKLCWFTYWFVLKEGRLEWKEKVREGPEPLEEALRESTDRDRQNLSLPWQVLEKTFYTLL